VTVALRAMALTQAAMAWSAADAVGAVTSDIRLCIRFPSQESRGARISLAPVPAFWMNYGDLPARCHLLLRHSNWSAGLRTLALPAARQVRDDHSEVMR
jgi:hypothetical protein